MKSTTHLISSRAHAPTMLPLIGLAILLGLMVAVDFGLQLLAVAILVCIVPAAYFGARHFADRSGWLLISGWILMVLTTGVQYVIYVPIGYLQELLLFGLSIGIVGHVWQQSRTDSTLRGLILIYVCYLSLCLLSTLAGRSHALAAAWQLQYNFKWPLMFGLGCMVNWGSSHDRQLQRVIQYSWVVLLACVALEIAVPGIHSRIFGPPPDLHQNPIIGFGLRYRGPFIHSGYLAITSALLAAASLAQMVARKKWAWGIVGSIYLALLLLSGQRQESMALLLSLTLMTLICNWRYRYLVLSVTTIAVLIGLASLVYMNQVPMETTLAEWGILNGMSSLSERAILSLNGITVANQYFPLGSGLGTYGGVGAQKFDQTLFLDLGFERYWWFRQGLFLVDTFWPGVIAESGFIGAAFLLMLFVCLWLALLQRTLADRDTPIFAVSLTALAALTLMLANSPSSGALTDPRGSFLFWILIGSVWQAKRPKPGVKPPSDRGTNPEEHSNAR